MHKIALNMVIFSHLSDIGSGMMNQKEVNVRTNFIKFLLSKYQKEPNALDRFFEIDPNKDFAEFINKFPQFSN